MRNGIVIAERPAGRPKKIGQLLVALGVDKNIAYVRPECRLHRRPWRAGKRSVLGTIGPDSIADLARTAYRRSVRRCHPDAGGSVEEMVQLVAAKRQLAKLLGRLGVRL